MKVKPKKNLRKVLTTLLALLVVVVVAVGTVWVLKQQDTLRKEGEAARQQQTPPTPVPVSIEANTLFVGDIYWGRYINDWAMASEEKTAYPFSRLSEFHPEKYDSWVANLECPTVAGFTQTSIQEDTTLSFNCNPDYLTEASQWFQIVSLANNHTDNRGEDGFSETKRQLDAHGIQYFGHYDPVVAEDACEVVALPVRVTYSDNSTNNEHLPVALCGYNGVFKIPPEAALQEIAKHAQYMPVVSLPHMGTEYVTAADGIKTTTYRAMIDQGADMVLGGHPHWIQNTEVYNGKLIVYSMGNFIFDQQANKEVTRSASIGVVMKTTDSSETLKQWLALGKTCQSFKDSCLDQAQQKGLKKLTMEYTFDVVGGNSANKVTKPASPAEQAEILQRLNWQTTIQQLHPTTATE